MFTGLCIGGPLDGKIINSRDPGSYRVPIQTLTTGRIPCGSSNEAGYFEYYYHDFTETTVGVFIPKGKTFAWAMGELLERYAK